MEPWANILTTYPITYHKETFFKGDWIFFRCSYSYEHLFYIKLFLTFVLLVYIIYKHLTPVLLSDLLNKTIHYALFPQKVLWTDPVCDLVIGMPKHE